MANFTDHPTLALCLAQASWTVNNTLNVTTMCFFQSDGAESSDKLYDLVAVVVHSGR